MLITASVLALLGAIHPPAAAAPLVQDGTCSRPFEPVSPALTDLGPGYYTRMDGTITDFQGGLYPAGSNTRPAEHEANGKTAAASIQPRDAQGQLDSRNGRIVLISIGMSNTAQEFDALISLADQEPLVNSKVFLLNGALGGRTAEAWADPNSDAWTELERRLQRYSITNQQVQVAWIKLTMVGEGDFPARAIELQEHLSGIVQDLKRRFPNLAIAFMSSRTRSYTYWRGLSPEPTAFETGFAVKWLIEQQINGEPELNFDPQGGEVKAPYLAWGPYLWADGQNARGDGFTWLPEDMNNDCTHPSMAGRRKIGQLLLDFLLNDSLAAPWFRADGAATIPLTATPTPAPIVPTDTIPAPTISLPTSGGDSISTPGTPVSAVPATQPVILEQPAEVQSTPTSPILTILLAGVLSAAAAGLVGFGLGVWSTRRRPRK